MNQLNKENALKILHQMVFKAVGCTEPVAAALAACTAYHELGGTIKNVIVSMDKSVYKNASAVGIPGTHDKGPKMAIALGLVCGDPKKGLLVLDDVDEQSIKKANSLLEKNIIKIELNTKAKHIHIQADITTTKGRATAIIDGCHDHIILIKKNHKVIYRDIAHSQNSPTNFLEDYDWSSINICDLLNLAEQFSEKELDFLSEALPINLNAANIGLKQAPGMKLGKNIYDLISEKIIGDDIVNHIRMMASSAVDARMGGIKVPVFACGGSGNHGITFFLTVGLTYEKLIKNDSVSLNKAYAFGLLLLGMIKHYTGILTPMCGCAVAAGAAAAAAITYALGGNSEQVLAAVNLVFGNIAGMICDGAKFGCALKINTSVIAAIEAALSAMKNIFVPATDGIVGCNLSQSLINLSLLHHHGMKQMDSTILEILSEKYTHRE